jgi:enoyl-CoA hydratase/carnithine racemase
MPPDDTGRVIAAPGSGGWLQLQLSRPDRRNAIDHVMACELLDAFKADRRAVVVLDSADPAAFCAGADLSVADGERSAVSDLLYECYEEIVTRPGPVIAVIGGPAVGGGAQLAAAADLRVAGPGARMRWIGPPGSDIAVGAWVLPDLVGRGAALDLTMTARWVGRDEMLKLGLANWIADEPRRVAAAMAESLLGRGAGVYENIKAVTAAGGLLDRLHAERQASRQAWARRLGTGRA